MNNTLMKIVLDTLVFFEFSDETAINPDVAIAQMENIVAALQSLPQAEREEFMLYAEKALLNPQSTAANEEISPLLSSLRDSLLS